MTIIVSKGGRGARKIERTVIPQEDYLQRYIYDNPDSLPLDEIREDIRLLILAREFPTSSGPIDALAMDQEGNIYLIETKLYKNADKRKVLAQVLDYGASLWRTYEDAAELITLLDEIVSKSFQMTLAAKVQEFYGVEPEAVPSLLDTIRRNLSEGRFFFVVLMDQLDDSLRNLITFVNRNSQFNIFGVELEFYKFEEYEILIPDLYGAEVPKAPGISPSPSSRKKWDEQSFFEDAGKKLGEGQVKALRDLYQFSKDHADDITWGTGSQVGSFNAKYHHIHPTRSLYTVFSSGKLQLNFGNFGRDERVDAIIERFVRELSQVPDFKLRPDYRTRFPTLLPAQWMPRIGEFKNAIRSSTEERGANVPT